MSSLTKTLNPKSVNPATEMAQIQNQYPEAASQSFNAGDLVYLVAGKVTVCPANPTLILGIALVDATGVTDSLIAVEEFTQRDLIEIQTYDSTLGTPAVVTSDNAVTMTRYNLLKVGDIWYADVGVSAAARVIAIKSLEDPTNIANYSTWLRVRIIDDYLQAEGS